MTVHPPLADAPVPPAVKRPPRGATSLFEIPFASAMNELDLALLERALDLTMRRHAKMHPRPDSPGFTQLDHYSGLFLERGVVEGRWMLEARTWGHPAPQSVHEWHVVAAGAAHQLDATVTRPQRLGVIAPEVPDRPLGRAANKRLARIRRRMLGLP
jgi:hypothetical protein